MRIEIYSRNRYFTVTGQHVPGTPDDLQERTEELAALCKDLFGSTLESVPGPESRASPERSTPGSTRWWPRPHWHPNDEDNDVLLARAHADPWRGDKFAGLFAGRWRERGYQSQSDADLALCGLLAYWTEGDAHRMDRLFRRSGLMRPKWDERRGSSTYGANTIATALS
jgi:primase-polymerase (primpol)-like protein